MEIKTKYNIDQRIYFIDDNNEPQRGWVVTCYVVIEGTDSEVNYPCESR